MVRIVHTSDTHLGHQQYGRTDPATGLNQRELDHQRAFEAVIDHAVATRPDCFIHAGDLFDGVRPSNRALAAALDGFLRLSQAGIPAVVIAGNHEHPKMRETGSPLRLLRHLPGVHAVFQGRCESIHLDGLSVHAVPQCADPEALRTEVEAIQRGPGTNVLVLHGAIRSLPGFQHAEFNELSLDTAWFDERFDYVALGHYHGHTSVGDRAAYCGAPDRVSMAESGEAKGFLEITLEGEGIDVAFRPLDGRPYVDLPAIDCQGLDANAVEAAAEQALRRVPAGAVARLTLKDLNEHLRGSLDQRSLRASEGPLHLDLRLDWADDDHRAAGGVEIGGLAEEFEAFAATQPMEGLDRERLLKLAREALAGAVR